MSDKPLSPFLAALLWAQQGIVTAMVASRFDPSAFERNMDAVRKTMRLAAASNVSSPSEQVQTEQEFEKIFDLYLQMFRTGDPHADGDALARDKPH